MGVLCAFRAFPAVYKLPLAHSSEGAVGLPTEREQIKAEPFCFYALFRRLSLRSSSSHVLPLKQPLHPLRWGTFDACLKSTQKHAFDIRRKVETKFDFAGEKSNYHFSNAPTNKSRNRHHFFGRRSVKKETTARRVNKCLCIDNYTFSIRGFVQFEKSAFSEK